MAAFFVLYTLLLFKLIAITLLLFESYRNLR